MNVFDKPRAEPDCVRAMPRREKVHGYELFDKPRAEPNLFRLCRGEKRCMDMNFSISHICVLKAAAGHPDRMSRCLYYIFSSGLTNRLRFEFLQSGQLFGETIQSIGLEVRKGKFTFQGRRGLHAIGCRSLIVRSFSEFYPRTHIHVS